MNIFQTPEANNVEATDHYFKNTKVLPKTLMRRLTEAYEYNAASSVIWLIKKLQILKERIQRGDLIYFEDGRTLTEGKFKNWIFKNCPPLIEDVYPETHKKRIVLPKKNKTLYLVLVGDLMIFGVVTFYLHWRGACASFIDNIGISESTLVCSTRQNFLEYYGESYVIFILSLILIYLLVGSFTYLIGKLAKQLHDCKCFIKIFCIEGIILLLGFCIWLLFITVFFNGQLCFFDSCEKISLVQFIIKITSFFIGFINFKLLIFILLAPFIVCYFLKLTTLKKWFLG